MCRIEVRESRAQTLVALKPTKVQNRRLENMGKGGEYAPSELEGEAAIKIERPLGHWGKMGQRKT